MEDLVDEWGSKKGLLAHHFVDRRMDKILELVE
jgi:hypothetical protein